MDQQYQQISDQNQRSVSPVRFDNDGYQINNQYYNGIDQNQQRSSLATSNSFGQQSFTSPQRVRAKPKIFENTPPYLQQTAAYSNSNLSFGSPLHPNQNNNISNLDSSIQTVQQQVQQLLYEKEILQTDVNNLQSSLAQLDYLLQQERRINRTVATELMIKVPSAERAILQLNEENQKLYQQLEQDKKLCSQDYLKSLELENLKLKVKSKQLAQDNQKLQSQIQSSQMLNQSSPSKNSPNKKPFLKISLNCQNEEDVEIVKNFENKTIPAEKQKSLNSSPLKQNNDEYHIQNYQNMESKLLKIESYAEILKQDNDKLEEANRNLNKKLKALTFEKEANENDNQQKILKLESLVTTLEYQLRKLKNQQEQQEQQYKNQDQIEQQPSSRIERNYQSNSNTIRILHDGDVNIKIEGEALNKITSVSVIQH